MDVTVASGFDTGGSLNVTAKVVDKLSIVLCVQDTRTLHLLHATFYRQFRDS
jgi:hypothetical protein